MSSPTVAAANCAAARVEMRGVSAAGFSTRSYPYLNTRALSGTGTGIYIPEYPILVRSRFRSIPEFKLIPDTGPITFLGHTRLPDTGLITF